MKNDKNTRDYVKKTVLLKDNFEKFKQLEKSTEIEKSVYSLPITSHVYIWLKS